MLESHVRELLNEEYRAVDRQQFFEASGSEEPVYSQQVHVGSNIYGRKRKVDFILYHPDRWKGCLVIQCKWQASGGSVEEKYPFEVACIKGGKYQTIIVLDGGGYSEGAKKWLLAQKGGLFVDVCDMGEISRMQSSGRL